MSTKEIETTYDITRQTLNNWIQRKIISKPTKKGNKNIWSRTNIIEIERAVSQKNGKTPFFEFDHEKLKIKTGLRGALAKFAILDPTYTLTVPELLQIFFIHKVKR